MIGTEQLLPATLRANEVKTKMDKRDGRIGRIMWLRGREKTGKPPQQSKCRKWILGSRRTQQSAKRVEFFVVLLRCGIFRAGFELWWHFFLLIQCSSTMIAYIKDPLEPHIKLIKLRD